MSWLHDVSQIFVFTRGRSDESRTTKGSSVSTAQSFGPSVHTVGCNPDSRVEKEEDPRTRSFNISL